MKENRDIYGTIGWVLASTYREKIILLMDDGSKNATDICNEHPECRRPTVVKSFHEMDVAGVVYCLDDSKCHNREYKLTELGKEVVHSLKNRKNVKLVYQY